MNQDLLDALDKAPWWARLIVQAGLAFGLGYVLNDYTWQGGIAGLVTWATGIVTKRPQDVRAAQNGA